MSAGGEDEVMRLGFQRGDNLALMRAMPDACVDLIYTDPPFNSGRDYNAAAARSRTSGKTWTLILNSCGCGWWRCGG